MKKNFCLLVAVSLMISCEGVLNDGKNSDDGPGEQAPVPAGLVDLGLSVLWSSTNLGAVSPEGEGDYFAWGETQTKNQFDYSNYRWKDNGPYSSSMKRTVLKLDDDAAYSKLGGLWRTPTAAEFKELFANCTVESTSMNEVKGLKFTSRIPGYTDKWIFFPAYGFYDGSTLSNSLFAYMSSSLSLFDDEYGNSAYFLEGDDCLYFLEKERWNGLPIRPVYGKVKPVASFTAENTEISASEDNSIYLRYSFTPSTATEQGIVWSVGDESVASVTGDGIMVTKKEGLTTVTASTMDGNFNAQWNVSVGPIVYPEAVDLGLSVRWSSFNLGARQIGGYSSYYGWGEIQPSEGFIWETYKWYGGSRNNMKKYNTVSYSMYFDGKSILEPQDDAAAVKLGKGWRMPTVAECEELINLCTWEKTELDGRTGYKVSSRKNGNWIFLPYSGNRGMTYLTDNFGCFWTATLNSDINTYQVNVAMSLNYSDNLVHTTPVSRYVGKAIRPVIGY